MKRKIEYFLASVVLIILASVIFDVWIAKYSLFDFYNILEDNNKVNELVLAMENEESLFRAYVKEEYHGPEDVDTFYQAVKRSRGAINSLPHDYNSVGAKRYSLIWSIDNAYEVYQEARDEVLNMSVETPHYVERLYGVYDMQSYLISYSRELMNLTLKAGDAAYSNTLPNLMIVPFVIIVVALVLTFASVSLVTMVNRSLINPIDELVKASKKIAGNEFFIDDVVIDNKDEMGELASAFNQMKFATGEYINALEDKRMTLDKLHEEELSRLEMERQVQNMKFDVLKNQINPHFLFNTLNVISGMAKLEGAATTDKMINALSSLFRYNLKT
ncbi:MAG: histidine kinase, partial [Pseudobutyrivibrio sp.]|nr:histidine kinase [Pseudobutyrivibrio sp.]